MPTLPHLNAMPFTPTSWRLCRNTARLLLITPSLTAAANNCSWASRGRCGHTLSAASAGQFHFVDCSAGAAALEHELFAALDPAVPSHGQPATGLLDPGTIFLQEVGWLSGASQIRLRNLIGEGARHARAGRPGAGSW